MFLLAYELNYIYDYYICQINKEYRYLNYLATKPEYGGSLDKNWKLKYKLTEERIKTAEANLRLIKTNG